MASYRQNRLVLFLKGLYNTLLQLVQACSISQKALQQPTHNQYMSVLFRKGPYNTLLQLVQACSISQQTTHTFLQLLQACSISQETIQHPPTISTGLFYFSRDHTTPSYNQYRPVLSLKGPYNTLLIISTHLFYFTESHATPFLQSVQACSIS